MSSQRFRYKNKELKVPTISIGDDTFVMLDDVQRKFNCHILGFTLDGEPLSFIRDDQFRWLEPLRIRTHIEKIIECDECDEDNNDDLRSTLKRLDDTTQKTYDTAQKTYFNTTLLITKTEAILRQTYELAEFTMPRMFIVLPDDRSRINPANLFSQPYRLFFLCECDHEHHLAFHEGYEINRPREFLVKYGPHLQIMFTVMKASFNIASAIGPDLSNIDPQIHVPKMLKTKDFWNGLNRKIDLMNDILSDVTNNNADQMNLSVGEQQLEGADLREIEHFLKKADVRRTLGNLYRSTTDNGAVRWMCIQHYRKAYADKSLDELKRQFRTLGGHLQFDVGTIDEDNLKNIDEMVDIIGQGLPIFELRLNKCKMRDSIFDKLLRIIGGHPYIRTFKLKNMSVSGMLGTGKSHRYIIAKLEKMLINATKLVIDYDVHIFDETQIDIDAFAYSLKNTNPRLILHIYTQPSLYLSKESNRINCTCQQLLQTFLKITEATSTAIIPPITGSGTPQYSLVTNLQLRLNEFDRTTLENFTKFLAKKNNIVTLGLSFHYCLFKSKKISNICNGLMNNDRLEKLSLNHCSLTDDNMMMITKMLHTTTSLKSLDLSNNSHLSFDGTKVLADVLKANQNLKTLILLNSDFLHYVITPEHLMNVSANNNRWESEIYQHKPYVALLLDSTSIEELHIGRKEEWWTNVGTSLDIGGECTPLHTLHISGFYIQNVPDHFFNSIAKNLINFSMSSCHLNGHDLCCIISELTKYGKLQSFKLHDLEMTFFSDEALEPAYVELTLMIGSTTSLKKLEVTLCHLGNTGVCMLAGGLKNNSTLEELNLKFNMIGTIGVQALTEVLQCNTTLIELNVSDNHEIVSADVRSMLESLKGNKTLEKLDISGCYNRKKKKEEVQVIQDAIRELSHINDFVTVSYYC